MKTSELAKEIGIGQLHAGRIRRKVSPDHTGGELTEQEIALIKKEVGIIEDSNRKKVRGIYGDSRYPNFVECLDGENKITVQIPSGYEPEMFINRSIWVERREYAEGRYVYHYNPFKQDD